MVLDPDTQKVLRKSHRGNSPHQPRLGRLALVKLSTQFMLDLSAALEFGDLGDSFFSFPSALVSSLLPPASVDVFSSKPPTDLSADVELVGCLTRLKLSRIRKGPFPNVQTFPWPASNPKLNFLSF